MRLVFPRPPSLPESTIVAGDQGWWDPGVFAGLRFEPTSWDEAIAADPSLAHQLGVGIASVIGDEAGTADLSVPYVFDVPPRPSRVLTVASLREYAFRAAADAVEEVVLAERVDAGSLASATLVVRLHRAPAWTSSTAQIHVLVVNTSTAPDEPSTLFVDATDLARVQIRSGESSPALFCASLSGPIATEVRVVLRWMQGRTVSSAEERFALSVDLVSRG
jgi:hypothetical protein